MLTRRARPQARPIAEALGAAAGWRSELGQEAAVCSLLHGRTGSKTRPDGQPAAKDASMAREGLCEGGSAGLTSFSINPFFPMPTLVHAHTQVLEGETYAHPTVQYNYAE